ncbi:hypothetical protein SOX05_08915 [Pseudomonas putida]|nr:hypothetical protein [Pseudomonas putida]MDY4319383.1 hypothetical protein [Pseudomonas putida]MDY4352768.1 hypothetical protein [Pseudomonas putida]
MLALIFNSTLGFIVFAVMAGSIAAFVYGIKELRKPTIEEQIKQSREAFINPHNHAIHR